MKEGNSADSAADDLDRFAGLQQAGDRMEIEVHATLVVGNGNDLADGPELFGARPGYPRNADHGFSSTLNSGLEIVQICIAAQVIVSHCY